MPAQTRSTVAHPLEDVARPLHGTPSDFDPLLDRLADARFVLLGEASHGTHEFYRARAEISRRLIEEHDFAAVAVEADWPDAYRVNRYVRGRPGDATPEDALAGFRRFPQWMWRNADVVDFVTWLREHNARRSTESARAGFYGLDLYSLHASIEAVIEYLRTVDPEAAARARERYSCFDHFGVEPQHYGYSAALGLTPSCEAGVMEQLRELASAAPKYAQEGPVPADEAFFATWNARVVASAEQYYRTMFGPREESWNLRDRHMADTLEALDGFLTSERGTPAKIAVWAHNSHLGDARATEMAERGELNVGQLARERYGRAVRSIGFTTYTGRVTAATDWDAPAERKRVRPALAGSYEALFHEAGIGNFEIDLKQDEAIRLLERPRLERAIGVIYRPRTERVSHYFDARLPRQFDTVLHYDVSRAVEPLERTPLWIEGEAEPPETYPSAL